MLELRQRQIIALGVRMAALESHVGGTSDGAGPGVQPNFEGIDAM